MWYLKTTKAYDKQPRKKKGKKCDIRSKFRKCYFILDFSKNWKDSCVEVIFS